MTDPNKRLTELVHDMRDEGDMLAPPRPAIGWRDVARVFGAFIAIYVLLTAVLVLTRG